MISVRVSGMSTAALRYLTVVVDGASLTHVCFETLTNDLLEEC